MVRFSEGAKDFLFSTAFRQIGVPPNFLYIECWERGSPGKKQRGLAADHSPPCNADVRNSGDIPPLPHPSSCRGSKLIHLH
jgi:hypothetical protein